MALFILDGNQSAATLSTIVVSSAHIPAHTVVSLGSQAITDIVNATSAGLTDIQLRASAVTVGGTVTIGNSLTIGGGTLTIGAGTAQIGSVTASISNFPATQTTTFGAITGSISVLNFPATQAISISSVTIGNFPATQPVSIASVTIGNTVTIAGTVTANPTGTQTIAGTVTANVFGQNQTNFFQEPIPVDNYVNTRGNAENDLIVPVQITNDSGTLNANNPLPISGTVTANVAGQYFDMASGDTAQLTNPVYYDGEIFRVSPSRPLPVALATGYNFGASVTVGNTVTIAGTVTANVANLVQEDADSSGFYGVPAMGINPDNDTYKILKTDQDGILAISGTVTANLFAYDAINEQARKLQIADTGIGLIVAGSTNPNDNPVIVSGTVTVGNTVTIAGTVTANLSISSTAITSGSFASLTSATLVPANTSRKMATVYNLGAGQLFVNAGATATTLGGGFMVALSSGDFYECNYTTTTLSAIFATAGTASWVSH